MCVCVYLTFLSLNLYERLSFVHAATFLQVHVHCPQLSGRCSLVGFCLVFVQRCSLNCNDQTGFSDLFVPVDGLTVTLLFVSII